MRSTARRAAVLAGIVIFVAACGHARSTSRVGAQPAATTAGTAPPPTQPTLDKNAPAQDRASKRRTYEQGAMVFDPPPATAMAHRNRAAALQAQQANPAFPNFPGNPDVQFASFTNNASGKVGPDGAVVPDHVQQPVWVVTFHNVPDAPAGGAHPGPGGPPGPRPSTTGAETFTTVLHDFVFVVDDATGSLLSVFSASPDA